MIRSGSKSVTGKRAIEKGDNQLTFEGLSSSKKPYQAKKGKGISGRSLR